MSAADESSSEVIFTINRKADQIPASFSSTSEAPQNVVDSGEVSDDEVKILCLVWKSGKMGAAYYNYSTKILYCYEEMIDIPPDFAITRLIYRELSPNMVLTFGSKGDDFVKMLIKLIEDQTCTAQSVRIVPTNLFLFPKKEYTFESCRTVLSNIDLARNIQDSKVERELQLNSLINFDYKLSVHAIGALVKYLDKNWVHFAQNREELQFFDIEQVSIKNRVLVDSTTLSALQVFQQCSHEASFKRGLQSSNREGLSVFKLFSSYCKSKLGQTALKNILMNPINDKDELTKRLDFIGFVLHPTHLEFVESLQDNVKNFSDLTLILLRINNMRANASDWRVLYKTIYHIVFINELSSPFMDRCSFLQKFNETVTNELISLENSINNAIDFTQMKTYGRPTIKYGLDQRLDAKKLRRNDIAKHVSAAAHIAVEELPDYIDECSIVYLPEMGHMIAIKEWAPGCNPDQLQELGFKFMFVLRGEFHYKNPICLELDQNLGDINKEIIAHENRILQRLSSFVMKYNQHIRRSLQVLAEMDALISMAKVAAQNNYTRPDLNTYNTHEIESSRHPLLELVSHFEPNDFHSGRHHSRIKIITGPNGSGKSIYLKQIGLVIYFAHIGSYVPAKKANIAMMYSLHTRMQATESASVRLSAFMIDVMQTTQALHNSRMNSLVLLDEFGRGTVEDEGFSLLIGALKKFYEKNEYCPHVVVSTHFQTISQYLEDDALVEHLKMDHTNENSALLYLYKINPGVSGSFAFDIAAGVDLPDDIIARAKQFMNSSVIEPLQNRKFFDGNGSFVDFRDVRVPKLD